METKSVATGELAGRLRLAVTRTARRLRHEAGGPLTPTLTAALATVANHGPLTPSELARREGVQRPTATKLVAKLEAAGLVERTDAIDDGRSCMLAATGEGRRVLADLRARKDVFLAERLEALPASDHAVLARAAQLLEGMLDG
jgi:DNA-binding MarR family transcriptional regulator